MKLTRVQSNLEARLGLPKFSGVLSVNVERTADANKGKREWLVIRYVNGEATVPRGYKPVEDDNGHVITKEIGG